AGSAWGSSPRLLPRSRGLLYGHYWFRRARSRASRTDFDGGPGFGVAGRGDFDDAGREGTAVSVGASSNSLDLSASFSAALSSPCASSREVPSVVSRAPKIRFSSTSGTGRLKATLFICS